MYLIHGAGDATFGAGVFFARGCTVYTKALVVVGITFPVLLPVVKAFSPFIALACLYLLFPMEGGWVFTSIGLVSVVFLFLHASLCSRVCQIHSATSYRKHFLATVEI